MDNTTFLLHALTLLGFNSTELLPGDTCEQRLAHTEVDIDLLVYPAGDDLSMEVRYWGIVQHQYVGRYGECFPLLLKIQEAIENKLSEDEYETEEAYWWNENSDEEDSAYQDYPDKSGKV